MYDWLSNADGRYYAVFYADVATDNYHWRLIGHLDSAHMILNDMHAESGELGEPLSYMLTAFSRCTCISLVFLQLHEQMTLETEFRFQNAGIHKSSRMNMLRNCN